MHPILNDSNVMQIFVKNGDGTIYGEDFLQMDIVPNKVAIKEANLNKNSLNITFSVKGIDYIQDTIVQISSKSIDGFNKEWIIGDVASGTTFSISLNLSSIEKVSELNLKLNYNHVNTIYYDINANLTCLSVFNKQSIASSSNSIPFSMPQTQNQSNDFSAYIYGLTFGIMITLISSVIVIKRREIMNKIRDKK